MMVARKYRKKPVVIEAIQWTGENLREVIVFTDGPPETRTQHAGMAWEQYEDLVSRDGLRIFTREDGPASQVKHYASVGDFVIRGVQGELYACKPDIFAATYEAHQKPWVSDRLQAAIDERVSDAALCARSSAPEAREEALGNLLAVIHGDGGHRALEVGTKQAALEAEKIVAGLFAAPSADKLREEVTRDQIMGVVRQYAAPAWCSVDRMADALVAIMSPASTPDALKGDRK